MALETGDYIDDLVQTNPVGSTDTKSSLDDHIRLLKKVLLQTFPNLTGPMTCTQAELNVLDGYTGTAADIELLSGLQAGGLSGTELSYVNGVTSNIQTQLDGKVGLDGQDWVLLDAQTASASATIDFEDADGMGSTYDAYKIVIVDFLPATDDVELRARVSVASSYLTTSIYSSGGQGSASASAAAYMAINTVSGSYGMGNGTHEGIHNLEILFSNPNSTSAHKSISWLGNIVTAAGSFGYIAGAGLAGTTSAVDGFRLYCSSGNIASGSFYFYGLRKS